MKWDYSDTGKLVLVVKAKTTPPQTHRLFAVRYIDADGVNIIEPSQLIAFGYGAAVGQPERVEASAPSESQIKRVKMFAAYRVLDDGSLVGPAVPPPAPADNSTPQNAAPPAATNHEPAKTLGGANGQATSQQTATQTKMDEECFARTPPHSEAKMKFSEELIKSLVYEQYSFETDTGGLSSPTAVGIKFSSIQLKPSYKNTVTVVPGRGAQRRNDAAPVDATIYNFHTKYIVCRKYKDSVVRTQYESDFAAFKAKNGAWACGVDSVPKIETLK